MSPVALRIYHKTSSSTGEEIRMMAHRCCAQTLLTAGVAAGAGRVAGVLMIFRRTSGGKPGERYRVDGDGAHGRR
jgi:hypothetical protein